MEPKLAKALYENALGELAAKYLEFLRPADLVPLAESNALKLIAEIQAILNDDTLEDPACLHRIDAIVDAFHARNISTSRHDW